MRKRLPLILLLGMLLTGCWDNRPVSERAPVLIISVDPAPKGMMRVAFFVPAPSAVAAITVAPSSGTSKLMPVETVARSFTDAIHRAQGRSSRRFYFGQTEVLVINRHLPPATLRSLLRELSRDLTIDDSQYVVAADTARKLADTAPAQNILPFLYLTSFFNCPGCHTVNNLVHLWYLEFLRRTPGRAVLLPYARPDGSNIEISRQIVYLHERPVLVLHRHQSMIYGFLMGRTRHGMLTVREPGKGEAILSNLHGQPRWSWQGPDQVTVEVRLTGRLSSAQDHVTMERLHAIERAAERKVTAEAATLLRTTQAKGADICGFGQDLLMRNPQAFAARSPWERYYPRLRIQIVSRVRVHAVGNIL